MPRCALASLPQRPDPRTVEKPDGQVGPQPPAAPPAQQEH